MISHDGLETTGCSALSCEECVVQSTTYFDSLSTILGKHCVWYVQQKPTGASNEKFETGKCGEPTENMEANFTNVGHGECKKKKKAWMKAWETKDNYKKILIKLDKLKKEAEAFESKVNSLDFTEALAYSMGDVKKIGDRVDGTFGPKANPVMPKTYGEVSVRDLWKHVSGHTYAQELGEYGDQEMSDRVKYLNKKRHGIWKSLIEHTCSSFTEEKFKGIECESQKNSKSTHVCIERVWVDCVCFDKGTDGKQVVKTSNLKQYVGIRQNEHRSGRIEGSFTLQSLWKDPITLTTEKNLAKENPGSIDVWDGLHRLSLAYSQLNKAAVTFMCSR